MHATIETARRALAFARSHDWGTAAELATQNGEYVVVGLTETCVWSCYDGTSYTVEESVDPMPATIRALREFGGY